MANSTVQGEYGCKGFGCIGFDCEEYRYASGYGDGEVGDAEIDDGGTATGDSNGLRAERPEGCTSGRGPARMVRDLGRRAPISREAPGGGPQTHAIPHETPLRALVRPDRQSGQGDRSARAPGRLGDRAWPTAADLEQE